MKIILNFFLVCALLCLIAVGSLLIEYNDNDVDFTRFNLPLTSSFYDRNGDLIARVFEENRSWVPYKDIPPRLIEALVAIEDTSFFEHDGINIDAIFRAIAKDIQKRKLAEGASTLTQQLVKNTYLTNEKSLKRKIKEALLSYKIERELSKETILERYLNYIFLGHGYYGIKAAAAGYFHKDLHELSLKEIAMLVGMPKAPSTYDPTRRLDLSLGRANAVLRRMYALGWISQAEYKTELARKPIVYDDTLTQNKAPYVVDEALRQLEAMGIKDAKTGGYKIELSIDLAAQQMAQEALKWGYDQIISRDKDIDLNQINGAMVVSEPATGAVLALVGGVDYSKSNFNRATQSIRQLGSSFKPFVYLSALNLGYNPASKIADIARVFETRDAQGKKMLWKPKNYNRGSFDGLITLKTALTKSRNLATINLMLDCGLSSVWNTITGWGFTGVPQDLSISLGSFGVSPYKYAELYSIISNYGRLQPLQLITRITRPDGSEVALPAAESTELVRSEQAFLMIDMMQNVVAHGTGMNGRVAGLEIAGKTGTSNKSIDAWFVGFSPEVQVITWYGNNNNKPMKYYEGGARTAAPVFARFMSNYLAAHPGTKRRFDIPRGVNKVYQNGQTNYYTAISPMPRVVQNDILQQQEDDGLMF